MKLIRKEIDYILLSTVIGIVLIGIAGIYSASINSDTPHLYQKQLIWLGISCGVVVVMQFFSPRILYSTAYLIYSILIVSLISVWLFGSIQMGARRWISIGGFNLQPSEIGKLALVIALARYFSTTNINWKSLKSMAGGAALTLFPVFLIFKQPDLGTSLVYIVVFLGILFGAGMPYFYILNMVSIVFFIVAKGIGIQFFVSTLVIYAFLLRKFSKNKLVNIVLWFTNLIAGISSGFVWDKLKPYQKMRILTFLDPEKYSREGGWQLIQSKIAVSNGGFFGEGFMKGSQTQLKFLPEGHTDFIFSVITEEFGAIGVIVVLALFTIVIYRFVKIISTLQNKFYYLLGVGILSIFIYQIFINIGMTIGVSPVTGLPLPFLSYGGSSLLFNMIMVGVIININIHKRDF